MNMATNLKTAKATQKPTLMLKMGIHTAAFICKVFPPCGFMRCRTLRHAAQNYFAL